MSLLQVEDLEVRFDTPDGEVCAVNQVSFDVQPGESLGIVGESGSGKSQVFFAVMGLLASNGHAQGNVRFRDTELLGMPTTQLNTIRGAHLSMIFQDPMTSLNPYLRVSKQMTEVLVQHKHKSEQDARRIAIELLERVQIPEAARRFDQYPHEFSGGMRQRVMIAMALLCEPDLLIADEPTTALDVTVQAQILDLLAQLRETLNTAIILISHDFGVVAGLCERVAVMYAGRIIETAPVREIFYRPQHPYTHGLLQSLPRLDAAEHQELATIPGQPPNLQNLGDGCAFSERCPLVQPRCLAERPLLRQIAEDHRKACHRDLAA